VVAFLGVLGGVVVVLRRVFVVLGGVQVMVVGGFVFHGLVFLCCVWTA
jgi:hypothetical protein